MRTHQHRATAAVGLLLLAALAAGCADAADDPRAASSPSGMPVCPMPNEPPLATPVPCISYDPDKRYAENHGYRREFEISDQQRAEAAGKAEALRAALAKLAGKPVDQAEVRAAAAQALGLRSNAVEVRDDAFGAPAKSITVGGGRGKVCVNGHLEENGTATAEVVGRTMDGSCIPSPGGH
ncbi:precorrin-3B C(17)-methyltransferase [Streptomyces sp. Qhu_M48]|uniref:precorrin-3B C(17)-methyltransferase n=1 Tax=Streptomyces sp. Qhu_M48 TaxID=3435889 RepID=UPI003F5093A1